MLKKGAVAQVLDQQAAYAPPGYTTPEQEMLEELEEPETEEVPQLPTDLEAPAEREPDTEPAHLPQMGLVFETVDAICPHCDTELPSGRSITYCPYCGRQVKEARCPRCGDSLEADWRFCVTCGHTVGG